MQRLTPFRARVRAARGLAVDGDDLGLTIDGSGMSECCDPSHEAVLERLRIERVDDIVECVVARNAVGVGQEAAQECEVLVAPSSISTKSSAPARLAARISNMISGSGYVTFQTCRGSASAEKWSIKPETAGAVAAAFAMHASTELVARHESQRIGVCDSRKMKTARGCVFL
jgi:hypothetical protein